MSFRQGARQFFERKGGGWTNPYVTDGLVAMWDGEWNAGGGVHDATKTSYVKDLVGNNDLAITLAPAVVSNNSIVFDGTQRAQCDVDFSVSNWLMSPGTVEIVSSYESFFDEADFDVGSTASNNRGLRPTSYGAYNRKIATCEYRLNTYRIITSPSVYTPGTPFHLAFVTDPQTFRVGVYVDGLFLGYAQGGSLTTFQNRITVGSSAWSPSTSPARLMTLYDFRLYSRALTADEIAANYAIDKARFNLP